MDDDFDDADLLQALAASEAAAAARQQRQPQRPPPPQQAPPPGRGVVQPTPQRLDKPPPSNSSSSSSRIIQPTPQPLPGGVAVPGGARSSSSSSILVSPRQKGNPVLASIKSTAWEYSDIPSDYVLGSTTCCLFLSLKYHRLHPEYIYTRIRALQNRYSLRILLTLVDIPNHEEPLRELSKTSLVNNVTVILCWSAQEAARYLELYKSYEHASAAAIRGQTKRTYAEQMVEFVTVPRSVNKTDAIALVSTFGSLRSAINATTGTGTGAEGEERLGQVQGWGEKKVKGWRRAVEGGFRVGKAKGRKAVTDDSGGKGKGMSKVLEEAVDVGLGRVVGSESGTQSRTQTQARQQGTGSGTQNRAGTTGHRPEDDDLDKMETVMATSGSTSTTAAVAARRREEEELGGGIAAALAKLRQGG
ncbi:restriction endonuclease type II-like protein [Sordaria sp. MPI-SDFR-AT-0083]|nr:restriction endonuclease type II-like protein [Sordaria sp. MPI-SDFR-AT-0083]